jgi:hypothetical protein
MSQNIDELFRLVAQYHPLGVGVEVTGQQGGFVNWIRDEMMRRNVYFNLTSDSNSNKPGIRPVTNKMARFQTVVPLFKMGKIYFPRDMDDNPCIAEALDELTLAAPNGFRSKHDDFIDTVSMLSVMKAIKPEETGDLVQKADKYGSRYWDMDEEDDTSNSYESYLV